MSANTWPLEPWRVVKGEWANEGRTFVKTENNNGWKLWAAETTHTVGPNGSRADEETARRIVACVNACAGIPTEALEAGALATLVEDIREAMNFNDPDQWETVRASLRELGR